MARLFLYQDKLRHNYKLLKKIIKSKNKEFAIVTNLLCENKEYFKEVLALKPKQICETRISNLKTIKKLNPNIETIYIKPPAPTVIKSLVKYADISFNTEFETIKKISREAQVQKKT